MEIRHTIIERLKAHTSEIHSLTDGLNEAQLKERPAEGKWSLHELTLHLCEVQEVFVERIARLLTEERPQITPYEPDESCQKGLYFTWDFNRRLKEFEVQRTTLASLLQTLTNEQWQLEGIHPEVKHYTIEKSMESLMRHEEHHLYQMYNIFFGIKDQR